MKSRTSSTISEVGRCEVDVRGAQRLIGQTSSGKTELATALAGLRQERERQGLSLTEVAERTGIDQGIISRLETGQLANPTIGILRSYARALGRRLAWTLETADAAEM
jgi:ribosome-binding protein aMBF1 (putative translation factor)